MNVTSLGYRTDLALLERSGSVIEDRGDHLVVRTPSNPTFYWGNFLLLDHLPPADRTQEWLDRFAAAHPNARHRAFGFDVADGAIEALSGFARRGFTTQSSVVMTASAVHPPPRPDSSADYRAVESDHDWRQSLELQIACHEGYDESSRQFVERRNEANRALVADGRGGWFGAFVDERLVSQMGLVDVGVGLARFQSVETHPDFRGRGLAGTLVHFVSRFGFDRLGARTLVMVADPEYVAIRIYRSVGFTASEVDLAAELFPGSAE